MAVVRSSAQSWEEANRGGTVTVDVRLLGRVEIRVGTEAVDIGHQRQQSLLAVLAVEANHLVSTDELIERAWAPRLPRQPRDTLYSYLSRLRRALADAPELDLTRRSGGYLLRTDETAVDLHRFHDLVGRARNTDSDSDGDSLFGQALALWQGEALRGLDSTWIAGMRTSLDQLRFVAELDQTDCRLRLGRHGVLVTDLSERAARHPLDERATGQLMLALYRCGRQGDALNGYERLRRRLGDELGATPSPELQRLHQQILTADPVLAPRPATALVPREFGEPAGDDDSVPSAGDDIAQPDADPLGRALGALSTAVSRQWTAEAQRRSLHRPEPVRLRWSGTDRPVVPNAALHWRGLHGDLGDVVGKFAALPLRQLVVLGDPGAGKTVLAILLTIGLLRDRGPNEPVPVLLTLSSWDPRRQHLDSWLASRLVEEYPGLANAKAYGREAALRLVTEGLVVPVLDGLDEMTPALRSAAIDALDRAVAGGRPLVMTCRGTEYEHAVSQGDVLSNAAVVEIEPVGVEDAITFLTGRERVGDARWKPVVDHLRAHPDGPLALALSTPLMVDLARTAYAGVATDPAELAESNRFPDRDRIEEHLLDSFVPAVYAHHPPPPLGPEIRPRVGGYRAEQAQRWLAGLARCLQRQGTRDFAWWQLVSAIPRWVQGLLLGIPPAMLFWLTGTMAAGPFIGAVYGVSFAVSGFLAHALGRRKGPAQVEFRFQGTLAAGLRRFGIGLAVAVGLGLGWSLSAGLVVLLVFTFGLSLAAGVWLDVPADATRVSSPAVVLRQDRTASLAFALCFALPLGVFYGVAFAFTKQVRFLPVFGGAFDLAISLAGGLASALLGRFLFDRTGLVVFGLAGLAVGGVVFSRASTEAFGFAVGGLFGLSVGLLVGLSRTWGAFVVGRAWLAVRGQSSLELMRFLSDAHRRGVLRQVGALYQFRHGRLQDRLATRK